MKLRTERLITDEGDCVTTDVDTEGEPCAVEVMPSGALRLVSLGEGVLQRIGGEISANAQAIRQRGPKSVRPAAIVLSKEAV